MGFIDRIASVLKQAPAPLQRTSQVVGARYARPDYASFQKRVKEGYMGNPVVAACVSVRANTLNEAPLVAQNATTGELLAQHPLSRIMANPNPAMSQAEFWQTVSTYVDVGGNAYIVKQRNGLGGVQALYVYNDGQMIPVINADGIVAEYRYDNGSGQTIGFKPADVIHIKSYYVDPLQPYLGLSPIVVSSIGIDAYNELMDTLYSTARNGGVVPGILSSQEFLPDSVVEQLKDQFQRKIGGRGPESGKPLVLSGGITYSQMGQEISALSIPELFSQFEVEICGAFRVDPAVAMTRAGLLSSTYANKETAFREYTKLTRVPTWTAWADAVTRSFASEFMGVKMVFDTTNVEALKPDPAIREQLAIQMWQANAITKNELRTETRYGELTDGNVFSDAAIYPIIAEFNANLITMNEARALLNIAPIVDGDKYAYELIPQPGGMLSAETISTTKVAEAKTVVIVDIDDTLLRDGNGIEKNVAYVNNLYDTYRIEIVSGRPDSRRASTEDELRAAGVKWNGLHLNDTTAPTIEWKKYKAGLLLEEYSVHLAIDNDADTRAMYSNLGISVMNPSSIPNPQESQTHTLELLDDEPPLQYYRQSEKEAASYWKSADKIMNDYAEQLTPYVADGMKTMLQQLTGQKAGNLDPVKIRIEELTRQYMTATAKVRESLLNEIFYLAVQAADGNPAEYQTILDRLTKQIGDYQTAMLTQAYGTARDEIGEIISKNVGQPEEVLQKALTDKVATLSTSRAATIARTVTRASATETQKSTWKQMNDDVQDDEEKIMRVWVTRRDGAVRPSHRKMDGLYVDVDGKFPEVDADGKRTGNTLDDPALGSDANPSSIINCRCVIRPVRKRKITSGYKPAGEG